MSEPIPANLLQRQRHRALRPLTWWVVLVMILFLIRTHQRLSEQTNLKFEPQLAGRRVSYETSTTLDNRPFGSGARVSIGWHTLTISHPKTRPVTTNLFLWYGEYNLGTVQLERTTGTLALLTRPVVHRLTIRGPEFSLVLTNTTGLTSAVPTDSYVIEAQFKHIRQSETVPVLADSLATRELMPKLAAVHVTCNQGAATFELMAADGRSLEQGTTPAMLTEIPVGTYRLTLRHRDNRKEETVMIKADATNELRIDFQYGAIVVETEPAGATVLHDRHRQGVTPLILTELVPGPWSFTLEREDYEPASSTLTGMSTCAVFRAGGSRPPRIHQTTEARAGRRIIANRNPTAVPNCRVERLGILAGRLIGHMAIRKERVQSSY